VRSTDSYMFLQYSPMTAISTVETCSCAYSLQDVLWWRTVCWFYFLLEYFTVWR